MTEETSEETDSTQGVFESPHMRATRMNNQIYRKWGRKIRNSDELLMDAADHGGELPEDCWEYHGVVWSSDSFFGVFESEAEIDAFDEAAHEAFAVEHGEYL
ncbi:MAG: hypothetical protein E7A62_04345 [Actinomycetaceae bacterium]|nr:hypothetical protein [Actinomycetaceae bacterium]MDU0970216.1 hypothetical protein [Actinomycetaceae bacterium]